MKNLLTPKFSIPEDKCFLFCSILGLSLLAGSCNKEDNREAGTDRIHRISEESGGSLQFVSEFFYDAAGRVSQIQIVDQTRYLKLYLFSHTQNTSTRRYQSNEDGIVYDLDSTILNAAGKPLAKYVYKNRKWILDRRFSYNGKGELAQIGIAYGAAQDSLAYFACYYNNGDLVGIENTIDQEGVFEYYTDKPTQVAGVEMIGILYSRGRVLLPNTHLLKSTAYEGEPPTERYEYEWAGDRISTVKYTLDSTKVVVQRISYAK